MKWSVDQYFTDAQDGLIKRLELTKTDRDFLEKVKQTKVKALFTEPQYPAKAATVISQETGVKVYSLDPVVTGESNSQAYDDYLNKMNANLKILQEALQ